jgi:hypothetical protein
MNLRHEKTCPWYPWRKLTIVEESELRDFRVRRSIDRNLPSLDELAKSVGSHPAGKHLRLVDDNDYVSAHSDDEDDSEVPW